MLRVGSICAPPGCVCVWGWMSSLGHLGAGGQPSASPGEVLRSGLAAELSPVHPWAFHLGKPWGRWVV